MVVATSPLPAGNSTDPHSSRLPGEKVRTPPGFLFKLFGPPRSSTNSCLGLYIVLSNRNHDGDQKEDQKEGKTFNFSNQPTLLVELVLLVFFLILYKQSQYLHLQSKTPWITFI